ncbi:MAG: tRNA pseudouridine(38-40) synthase TruA [Tissierellaceae bacterium]|nr:tRNA pseudouridine(38-40) synthase TruA [Tissierellaceae bacterium]
MRNIKLLIEYDGTSYSGWQSQDNAFGIQEVIENAIEKTTGERVKLVASGRTDAKVHAKGQVANFYTNCTIPGKRFKLALNMNLPDDIIIIDSEEVDIDFHSRFSSTKKRYRYIIYNGRMPSPLYRNLSYHVGRTLNIEEMRNAIEYFIGEKDFKSFMGRKAVVHTTVRELYSMEIIENGEFIEIVVVGKSFLKNMIRIIVGTLVFVGIGRIKSKDVEKIIEGKDRRLAGPTAPPQGLYLEKVYYD